MTLNNTSSAAEGHSIGVPRRTVPRRLSHGIVIGTGMAITGLMIILWPEQGLQPHPLAWPPSASTRPIGGYAVFGYPLLGAGVLVFLASGLSTLAGRLYRGGHRPLSQTRRRSGGR